jgi:hypothetical protein
VGNVMNLTTIATNLFQKLGKKEPAIDTIFLDASKDIKLEEGISNVPNGDIEHLRRHRGKLIDSICSNSSPEHATDLLLVTGRYTYRSATYVIATLDWTGIEDMITPTFEQVRANFQGNLWSHNPETPKPGHTPVSPSFVHTSTVSSYDMSRRDNVNESKREARKVAAAYRVAAEHCLNYNWGEHTHMYAIIADAFEAVSAHKIRLPDFTSKEKEELRNKVSLYRTRASKGHRGEAEGNAKRHFSQEWYLRIVPSMLTSLFLEKLNEYELFREHNLTSIDPKVYYTESEIGHIPAPEKNS